MHVRMPRMATAALFAFWLLTYGKIAKKQIALACYLGKQDLPI